MESALYQLWQSLLESLSLYCIKRDLVRLHCLRILCLFIFIQSLFLPCLFLTYDFVCVYFYDVSSCNTIKFFPLYLQLNSDILIVKFLHALSLFLLVSVSNVKLCLLFYGVSSCILQYITYRSLIQ